MANGNHEALEKLAASELQADPYNVNAFYKKLTARCLKKPSSEGKQEIEEFLGQLVRDGVYERENAEELRHNLMAHMSMLLGDTDAYKEHIKNSASEGSDYIHAVLDGHIESAREILERDQLDLSGNSHLMLYSLAMQQGKNTLADECLKKATECFSNGSKETRKWEKWFNGNDAPKMSELLNACQDVEYHYAVLVAFAQRFPEKSREYMEHARKICYEKDFNFLALRSVLKI